MGFLFAHLSDAHIGPLPKPRLRELAGKRLTGYVNWRRGRDRTHDMGALGALVVDMRGRSPDHVAMTGDVLNLALPGEFPAGRAWLETLGAPEDVSFTPGNHDAYVRKASARLASAFAPYTTGDDGVAAVFPFVRRRGPVALIGLCSGVPRAPFVASGRLGAEQCAALAGALRRAREEGLMRVVLVHHPPHRSGSRAGRGLVDARAFEAVIAQEGAELVLHGHNHRASVAHVPSARCGLASGAATPVVGVPSASAMGRLARPGYHLFDIGGGPGAWTIAATRRSVSKETPGLVSQTAAFNL